MTRVVRRHYPTIAVASGAMLVTFGVLLATGELTRITSKPPLHGDRAMTMLGVSAGEELG